MKACLALIVLLMIPGFGAARIGRAWTHKDMFEKADLVVIAKPVSITQLPEPLTVPDFQPETKVFELRTIFSVSLVLKGSSPEALQISHFKLVNPHQFAVYGPSFVEFDPSKYSSYLMFLSFGQGGSYVPVTGQTDATTSIMTLRHGD